MKKDWLKKISILSIAIWIVVGIYGLIFNHSYIDEAKYLIKGWLMFKGEVGYYSTSGFFYQHMPGSLLFYGLGQKIWGPSLLVGRLQSFFTGLLIVVSSWWLSKKISGKLAGVMTLVLLSLCPTVNFYYSTSTPQSILLLILIIGFINLYDGLVKRSRSRLLWATVCFSLTFIIRENFLFTLLLYLGFLLIVFRKNLQTFFQHLLVTAITLSIFILPGYPGTVNILKNFPGVSMLLPVSQVEKEVLNLYWKEDLQTPLLYWQAIRDFGVVFHAWVIIGGLLIVYWWVKRGKWRLNWEPKSLYWMFLVGITGFNFVIHSWAAFKLSPRGIISYFPYVAPLVAVIMADRLSVWLKSNKNRKMVVGGYVILLGLLPIGLRYGRNFVVPTKWPDLRAINRSGKLLKPLVKDKEKIVWISEPISLYMAGKAPYYPLINHINFYKPTDKTQTAASLGFWNIAILEDWFEEADLVVIGDNKMRLLRDSNQATELADFIEDYLASHYKLIWKNNNIWPGDLSFYEPLGRKVK